MFSPVASTIFAYRNAEKTKNGDLGRGVVTVGQCTGVVQEFAKYDNVFSAATRNAVNFMEGLAKDNKVLGYAGKCLKFTADNVNPLICASSVLKVATSDDKVHSGITEVAALSGMFLGEAIMKETFNGIFNSKNIENVAKNFSSNNVLKSIAESLQNSKVSGKVASILKGVLFVGGSMTSYALGQKAGNYYADDLMDKLGIERKEKINQKA